MDYLCIKSEKDITYFLERTNYLHDGYITSVQYINNGITRVEGGYEFSPELTKLTLKILVTSIQDVVVKIEFENPVKWKIEEDGFSDILDTALFFNSEGMVVWANDELIESEDITSCSYVIAESMKWKIVE